MYFMKLVPRTTQILPENTRIFPTDEKINGLKDLDDGIDTTSAKNDSHHVSQLYEESTHPAENLEICDRETHQSHDSSWQALSGDKIRTQHRQAWLSACRKNGLT